MTKSFAATRDNSLFEYTELSGDLSEGAGSWIFSGRTNQPANEGPIRRGLILFDLVNSGIPPNALVTRVTLQLHLCRRPRLRPAGDGPLPPPGGLGWEGKSFSQGTGGTPTPGDVHLAVPLLVSRSRYSRCLDNAGRDFSPAASADTMVDNIGAYTWSSLQMVLDVQDWLLRAGNQLRVDHPGNETLSKTAKRFDSRQNPTAANRPLLIIEYQPELKTFYFPIVMKQ